ncbi:MAG: RNA polymerase factor sigma-32 [Deltaproteobacteria bacterium]|jgi:RNA polymerase sigma-32 factor|nr:RNA polymerase factor sigma-32 [Deltaproteobacteria bacterium]
MAKAVEKDTLSESTSKEQVTTMNTYHHPLERPIAQVPVPRIKAEPPVLREKAQPPSAPLRTDSFNAYLADIRRFKLLTPKEEEDLLKDYQATKNPETARRLVTANLRLVVKIALDFQSHWLNNLQDLVQEGNMGLMQALKKFDPGKGVKFSYYASYWIKAYILKYIMENWRLVKVGTTQAQRKLFFNLRKEQEKLVREGLEPASGLLAERLGVSEDVVKEMDMRMSSGREISLDAPVTPGDNKTHISLLPSNDEGADDVLSNNQMMDLVSKNLDQLKEKLSERELIILNKRLLTDNPVTLQELGEEFGVTRERIRQLEDKLKKTIKKYLLKTVPDLRNY